MSEANLSPRTFLIDYKIFKNGNEIKSGQIKAKKKKSEFDAKCGSGKFLENKYPNCEIRISKCKDTTSGFADIFSQFENIFGGKDTNKNYTNYMKDIFKTK